jgi:hypothetical protein
MIKLTNNKILQTETYDIKQLNFCTWRVYQSRRTQLKIKLYFILCNNIIMYSRVSLLPVSDATNSYN